jgi:polyisoprenoid-binding protein YceI
MKALIRIIAPILILWGLLSYNTYVDKTKKNIQTFEIDTLNSSVKWFCTQHKGKIKVKKGTITFVGDSLNKVSISMNMKTITNEDIPNKLLKGTLENILKSPDFFNVEKYPEATFNIYRYKGEKDNLYLITGDIHLLRNDICSTFPVEIIRNKDSIFVQSKPIILDRTDWGIYYLSVHNLNPKEGDESFIVSDTIEITLNIKGFKN